MAKTSRIKEQNNEILKNGLKLVAGAIGGLAIIASMDKDQIELAKLQLIEKLIDKGYTKEEILKLTESKKEK